MTKKLDLLGQRFTRWIVIAPAAADRHGRTRWLCRCDCGTERAVDAVNLRKGLSPSCGCKKKDNNRERLTTHGLSKTRLHRIWANMIQRCHSEQNPSYPRYGGRGISVCNEWRYSFEAFIRDMGHPPEGQSIDRVDNNRGYEPGNCRWATVKEQAANRRSSRLITHNGKTLPLIEWARMLGLHHMTISDRIARGWPLERALSRIGRFTAGGGSGMGAG